MSSIGDWLAGLFGTAFGIALLIFGLLSLPFSVIALVRWFELSWWTALIAAILIPAIPILGQLAFLVFAIAGAYFFISSDYSFERATYTNASNVSFVSSKNLSSSFKEQLHKSIYRSCANDKTKYAALLKAKLKGDAEFKAFCNCYADSMVKNLKFKDLENSIGQDAPNRRMAEVARTSALKCMQ